MAKKTILLIEDDAKTESAIREALPRDYDLAAVKNGEAAAKFLKEKTPDLILIDLDLKGKDGLQTYRELQPQVKVIMLSASGSIPQAVAATKSGVSEFLIKPVNAEQLKSAVEKNIAKEEARLRWVEGMEWLRGESPKLKSLFSEIRDALDGSRDILLIAERGIPRDCIAELLHENSSRRGRKLFKIDLASYRKETQEPHFWTMVKKFMEIPETSALQGEEDRCGTLYLENIDELDDHFKLAVFNFFKERRGSIDKGIRAVFGVYHKNAAARASADHAAIELPPLRERKEDLPVLLEIYLKRSSARYDKNIKFVSAEILDLLAAYDFPGNYLEFEKLIEAAVLEASGEAVESKNFPVDPNLLLRSSLKKSLSENLTLGEAKRRFEKKLYRLILTKSEGDTAIAARFLDIPRTVLTERLEDLAD